MWMSRTIPYISLFCHQQIHAVIFIFFSCTMHYIFNVYFYTILSMRPFPFNRSQSKAGIVNQMNHPCFRKRSAIGQLNIQVTTAEKLYTLSNILYIKF